jgi:hypothetical protein
MPVNGSAPYKTSSVSSASAFSTIPPTNHSSKNATHTNLRDRNPRHLQASPPMHPLIQKSALICALFCDNLREPLPSLLPRQTLLPRHKPPSRSHEARSIEARSIEKASCIRCRKSCTDSFFGVFFGRVTCGQNDVTESLTPRRAGGLLLGRNGTGTLPVPGPAINTAYQTCKH